MSQLAQRVSRMVGELRRPGSERSRRLIMGDSVDVPQAAEAEPATAEPAAGPVPGQTAEEMMMTRSKNARSKKREGTRVKAARARRKPGRVRRTAQNGGRSVSGGGALSGLSAKPKLKEVALSTEIARRIVLRALKQEAYSDEAEAREAARLVARLEARL